MVKKIFLGPPNSGKGTYASRISPILQIPHISTGDLFREHLKNETEIGLKAKSIMDAGELVPDEITIQMVKERLTKEDCKDGFILDGFPRTLAQAEALAEIVDMDAVVNINIPMDILMDRMMGRITCKDCGKIYHAKNFPPKAEGVCDSCQGEVVKRAEDNEETIKKRLDVYDENTKPLIDFYRDKGILINVDSIDAPEVVVPKILRCLM
ncbi:MAG: adenylate kinase, partial [Candidatus Pacearchaeota archaeon]|nr:adenylate kinase [Candidatus Pacearchaeota archaeon]